MKNHMLSKHKELILLNPQPKLIPNHFKSKPSFVNFIMIKASAMKNKIMSKYLERKADVIACLREKGNSKVSSTTDLWTLGNNLAMITVTGTWININFEMREGVLGFRGMPGQHSEVNIAESFYGVLTEYQSHTKASRAGTDAAFEKLNKYYKRTQGAHLVTTVLPFEVGI
ncbi:hypothetical protein DAPPUDRAFT_255041 [Daphnia pulex]|uniref:Uncharacterized protein n=1 Tax=Daphnia pulex TaxID=6669 RepID=E9H8F7_DAPPU|nr:hypothetical protein DAPPUDRAFT_255041 [Daphnia pulex]|eukprot:EFX71991.1 hypothetical protein DAPPUDRAFT_255041 [Daphnia pulex]